MAADPRSPSAASYMLFDRASGNAVNGYDDAGEAQDALRRSVEANPECVETLVLIPFDADGMPCDDSITFADLPASPSAAKERAEEIHADPTHAVWKAARKRKGRCYCDTCWLSFIRKGAARGR